MEDRRGEGLSAHAIDLVSGECSASISLLGAEAVSWRVQGRDLLWGRSTSHWDRVAPVLFPCVGWSRDGRVRVADRSYPMPVHGFAPSTVFDVIGQSESSLDLQLRARADTLACYPFSFSLRVSYALVGATLTVTVEVTNTGRSELPYACGLHPGFAWPFGGGRLEDYRIEFSETESDEVPIIAAGGLFSDSQRKIGFDGRMLPLSPALFAQEALCFLNARSRQLSFIGPDGAIVADTDRYRHWALWSRPGAPFLCMEAWTGHGDPEGFDGDFCEKPSIERLNPGETRRHALTLSWRKF